MKNNSAHPRHPWRRKTREFMTLREQMLWKDAALETFRPERKHEIQGELLVPDGVISRELQLSHRTMEHV